MLANDPDVLLMDEPFAALDAQTRVMMQDYLLGILAGIPKTVLFITHDIDEALLLGDRVVVMSASPGMIIADLVVELPRPRPKDAYLDPNYLGLKRRCVELIREQSLKTFSRSRDGQDDAGRLHR